MRPRCTLAFKTGPLAGRTFSVAAGEKLVIGSGPDCTVRIQDDPTVSATHVLIYYDDESGRVLLKDLGSQYGTARNGKKLKGSIRLRAGDRITVGKLSTFHSSWWNALLASRMTRFSRIATPTGSLPHFARVKNRFKWPLVGALLVGLLAALAFATGRWQQAAVAVPLARAEAKKAARKNLAKQRTASAMSADRRFIWDEIVSISSRFGEQPPSAMDPEFVKEVERNIQELTRNDRHLPVLERKAMYWPLLTKALREKRLPVDLAYVVWVESGFDRMAVSPASAVGLWQLIPDTAREYGLIVDAKRDERTDPWKSSLAAADYITDLLRLFKGQRYLLALASYNTGQMRVQRLALSAVVSHAGGADFWQIRDSLPRETNVYVPRIMAAMIVGRNVERWATPKALAH